MNDTRNILIIIDDINDFIVGRISASIINLIIAKYSIKNLEKEYGVLDN